MRPAGHVRPAAAAPVEQSQQQPAGGSAGSPHAAEQPRQRPAQQPAQSVAGSAAGGFSPFQEHGLVALLEAAEAAPAAAEAGPSAELVDQTTVLQRHLDGMTVRGCPGFCQACAQALVLPGSEHGMPCGRRTALAPLSHPSLCPTTSRALCPHALTTARRPSAWRAPCAAGSTGGRPRCCRPLCATRRQHSMSGWSNAPALARCFWLPGHSSWQEECVISIAQLDAAARRAVVPSPSMLRMAMFSPHSKPGKQVRNTCVTELLGWQAFHAVQCACVVVVVLGRARYLGVQLGRPAGRLWPGCFSALIVTCIVSMHALKAGRRCCWRVLGTARLLQPCIRAFTLACCLFYCPSPPARSEPQILQTH